MGWFGDLLKETFTLGAATTETWNEDEYAYAEEHGIETNVGLFGIDGGATSTEDIAGMLEAEEEAGRQTALLETLQVGAPGKSIGAEEDEEEMGRRSVKKARLGTKALQIGSAPTITTDENVGGNI